MNAKLSTILGEAALVLLMGAVAAASPPNPLPAYTLPGDATPAPAAGDQTGPAISRGGGQYLAVWTDARTALETDGENTGSGKDIFAARLDAVGDLIDTVPIAINVNRGDQYDPVVEWNGTDWLVLWTDSEPFFGDNATPSIRGARVSAAGEVLDPEPLLIWVGGRTRSTIGEHLAGFASNGVGWAVVVTDQYVQGLGNKIRLVGRRITPDGSIVDAPRYLYSPACCSFFFNKGLAYTGGEYLFVFEGYVDSFNYGIFGLRLTDALVAKESYPQVLAEIAMQGETHYYIRPRVAAADGVFYATWELYNQDIFTRIYGARILPGGTSLDGDGVPISGYLPPTIDVSTNVVWTGIQWVVGWEDGTTHLARVATDGTVLDTGGIDTGLALDAFCGDGSGSLNSLRSSAAGTAAAPFDIFQAGLTIPGGVGSDQCISLGAPAQVQPRLATGDTGYLLAYRSVESGLSRIMAHPLASDAQALFVEPVELASGDVTDPRAAFDGTRFLVVWSDETAGEIHGRRLDEQGNLLDGADLVLLSGSDPDVTAKDGEFLVTASQTDGVQGRRVAGDGSFVDDPPVLLGGGPNLGPRSAVLGANYLTVWEAAGGADGGDLSLSLLNPDGMVIGPIDLTTPDDGLAHHHPAVASGDTALVVWEDDRDGNGDLYGVRIIPTLSLLDTATGFPFITDPADQSRPDVAWDGREFMAVFSDDRNVVDDLDHRSDIYRSWVLSTTLVPEPDGLGLYAEPAPEVDPTVTGRGGNALYAASRFTAGGAFGSYRVWLRNSYLPSGVDGGGEVPRVASTVAVFPNPANPRVTLRFNLPRPGAVRVDIYTVNGARVRTLNPGRFPGGWHELEWSGRDATGSEVSSGTYLYRFEGADIRQTGKITLVR